MPIEVAPALPMRRWTMVIVLIASLQGALGVALSAAAAHIESSANLWTASVFLMVHAVAGLSLVGVAGASQTRLRWLASGSFALQAGVTLFSGDLAWRAFAGSRLFPYAAPIGGSLVMLSWLAIAAWALLALARPSMAERPFPPRL